MPHSWHWVLLEEERKKKPGTSVERGRYTLSFSEAPKPGELQERVSDKAETASNKAETKSMTMMLAGTPPDGNFSGVISMGPEVVDHAVIPLAHSVDLEECILDFKRVHKDHQQARRSKPKNSGNWLYLGWHLEMKTLWYHPQ